MQAPSASSNSILLNIDNTSCYNVGGNAAMPTNTWTWVNYNDGSTSNVMQAALSQGNHSLTLTGTESGVSIDRIEALADNTCVPTGTGDNCTPVASAPTVSLTAPVGGAKVGGTVNVTASASTTSPATVSNVQFQANSANITGCDPTAPTSGSSYACSWNTAGLDNGTQNSLSATVTDSTNATAASTPVTVTIVPPNCNNVPLLGDLDNDCHVTGHDLSIQLSHYGTHVTTNSIGDLDTDSQVTGHDLSILLSDYGK
jgi:hypothetical protein